MGFMPGNNLNSDMKGFIKISSLAVIGLFFLIYIAPLGIAPIVIPDEARYSEIPREMVDSGDWVVPRQNNLRYFEKPVMGYWISAFSIMLFGENGFATRFPSAASTGISALILFFMVRRFTGEYRSGLLTAAIFLTFVEVFGIGSFCILDAPLSLFITSTMAFYFVAVMETHPIGKNLFLVLSGISCGLAFLTKGFLAFVLPLIIIVPYMVWERRFKDLLKSLWIPALSAILISLPWAILIHLREPDFWHYFFWHEHIERFMAEGAQHKESFWYLFKLLPLAILPWTFLIPAAWSGLRQRKPSISDKSIARFAICWFLFPFLFFSTSSGKLATYILPCLPPLAILLAVGIHHYFVDEGKRSFNICALLHAGFIVLLIILSLWIQIIGIDHSRPYVHAWKLFFLLVGFLVWAIFLISSTRSRQPEKKIILYALAPLLFMFAVHFCIPDLTILHKMPEDFLLKHYDKIRQDTVIVSDEHLLSSACWFYKRTNVYLIGDQGEFTYGLNYEDSKARHLNLGQFEEFILKHREAGPVTLIAREETYRAWKEAFPEAIFEDSNGEGGFIFAQFQ
jgi:4-amino-4-deoxy-L-arabinose transferase